MVVGRRGTGERKGVARNFMVLASGQVSGLLSIQVNERNFIVEIEYLKDVRNDSL